MNRAVIENDQLKISVNEKGAELSSLLSKTTSVEYIWQADDNFWGRHAPVLFPIVGKLKNDEYQFDGKTYSMKQHGFARDSVFNLSERTENKLVFQLSSDAETKRIYPFDFDLFITYELNDDKLSVEYRVLNKGLSDMYFSIGAHPAFNCPLDSSLRREDHQLVFEKDEKPQSYILNEGNFSGETKEVFTTDGIIDITPGLFDDDALVFKNLKSNRIGLQENGKKPYLTVRFDGFPYLGIWSKNRLSPFICIEPWCGLADNHDHNGSLEKKEGIQILKKGEKFSATHEIIIH